MFASLLSQVVIVLTSTGVSNGLSCEKGDLAGYFEYGTNRISICSQDLNPEYVKYHELAHFLFFERMNGKERAAWFRLSESNTKDGAYVSEYSKKGPAEDFAEIFAFIAVDGKIAKPSNWRPDFAARKKKFDFVKASVKKYGKARN